jgi:hypothetical protein
LGRVNRGLEIQQIIVSPGLVSGVRKIGEIHPGISISGDKLEKGLDARNFQLGRGGSFAIPKF